LIWVYDIDRIIRAHGDRLDWEALLDKAASSSQESALYEALNHTLALYGTPIQEYTDLAPVQNINTTASKAVLGKMEAAKTRLEAEWRKLSALSLRDRFRLITALLLPSPAYMRWRYRFGSYWLLPFYYLFRWVDIFIDGLRFLSDRLQG
jgi:hypothetical protein